MPLTVNGLGVDFGYIRPTMPAVAYGDVIRKLRTEAGLTQPQLAKLAHVGVEMVVHAEQSGNVTVFKLHQLATALHTDISAFFCGERERRQPLAVWNRLHHGQKEFLERLARQMLAEQAEGE